MVSPSSRRRAVKRAVENGLGSTAQARKALRLAGSCYYLKPQISAENVEKRKAIIQASERHPRYGYRRVSVVLKREGVQAGKTRVQRIRRQEGLQVRKRQRKTRRQATTEPVRQRAERPNHVWSWDFVEDQTGNRSRFRILSLIDEYTRECHSLKPAWSIRATDAIKVIESAMEKHGSPEHIRSDNGPEFIAYAMQDWLTAHDVKTAYIRPGSPWEQGHVESFHDKLRDELLNREIFSNLNEAEVLLEGWRKEYNEYRPHSSLGYMTPADYRATCRCPPSQPPAVTPAIRIMEKQALADTLVLTCP